MNDYDDSEDYSSSNSFRARSNTWPLNRPDLAVPNSVCIDETLPEIELEEDDLFTTNDNWSTSNMVDHDIMSWDPILNAQQHHLHHQQHLQHQPQLLNTNNNNNNNHQQQHLQTQNIEEQQTLNSGHQQQQQQQHLLHQHQSQQILHADNIQQANHNLTQDVASSQSSQQQQRLSMQTQHLHNIQTTTTSQHTVSESNESNEYHLQQLHHLRIDNSLPLNHHYTLSPTLSSPSSSANNNNNNNNNLGSLSSNALTLGNYNLSSDHHQHHNHLDHSRHHHDHHHQQQRQLVSLSSANYNDLDNHHHNDLNLISTHEASSSAQQHVHHHNHHQQHHHHNNPHLMHHQHHNQHQLHHLTSDALDQNPLIMSTTADNGLLGLGGDLEDLDYNKVVDPSVILQNPTLHYEEQQNQGEVDQSQQQQQLQSQQQQQLQSQQQQQPLPPPPTTINPENANNVEQSTSTTSNKTKLNTPRRNAWGNMSYADLISQAINSTTDKRLTLSQIYDWMVQHVPYFKDKGDSNSSAGWKNSVRHNLSLHNRFKRLQNEGTGKSSWWTINPETNVGKCARRRAASMEASKYEKKRGRAKKRAEAIRQGLVSYPSLTSSLLNGSSGNLDASDLQKIQQASSSTTGQIQPEQEVQNPASDNGSGVPVESILYNSQYEQKDIGLHQIQQEQQQQMSHSPPKKILSVQKTEQEIETSSQQHQPQQQLPDQVQQIHQIVHKTEQADFDSYYIQHNHQDLHQLQNHQGHLDSRDKIDLFNRHAIYLSEPCNDCNCTELINCGTNAMSYT